MRTVKSFLILLISILFASCGINPNYSEIDSLVFHWKSKPYKITVEHNSTGTQQVNLSQLSLEFSCDRAIAPVSDERFIVWNAEKKSVEEYDEKSFKWASVKIEDAGQVKLNSNYILTCSQNYDSEHRFYFQFFKINHSDKLIDNMQLEKIFSGYLNCFVSSVAFTEKGINGMWITGQTYDNSVHNFYYLDSDGFHLLYTVKKDADFPRLIQDSNYSVYGFMSKQEASEDKTPLIYLLYSDGSQTEVLNLSELTDYFAEHKGCYLCGGDGLRINNQIGVPCTDASGKTVLIGVDFSKKKVFDEKPEIRGCFRAISMDRKSFYGSTYFINQKNSNDYENTDVCSYDGRTVKSVTG